MRSQAFPVVLIMYLFKTVYGGHDKRIACIQCGVHFAKKCRSGEVFYILCSRVLWLESNSRFASIAQLLPIATMAAAAATTPGKYPDPPYNSETDASCLQCFFPDCRMQRKGYASMMSHIKQDHTEKRMSLTRGIWYTGKEEGSLKPDISFEQVRHIARTHRHEAPAAQLAIEAPAEQLPINAD